MYSTGSNDRAARAAYEHATPGASWDELAYEDKNRWRDIAFAARAAAGDIRAPAGSLCKAATTFRDLDLMG